MEIQQMPNPVTLTQVFNRIFDNVNAGKALSDGMPGFVLALGILLLLAGTDGIKVLPIESRPALKSKAEKIEKALYWGEVTKGAKDDKSCLKADPCKGSLEKRARDLVTTQSQNRIDTLRAKTKKQQPIQLLATDDPKAFLEIEKTALVAALVRLRADRDKVDAAKPAARNRIEAKIEEHDFELTAVQTMILQLSKARAVREKTRASIAETVSITKNMEVITANLGSLLFLGVALAILMGQVNRYIFIRKIYDPMYYKKFPDQETVRDDPDVISVEKMEQLVSHYYRYMEGAINMIVPTVVVGWGAYQFMDDLGTSPNVILWILPVGSIAFVLFWSGYATYTSFRKKIWQLKKQKEADADGARRAAAAKAEARKQQMNDEAKKELERREAFTISLTSVAMAAAREIRCAVLKPCDEETTETPADENGDGE